MKVLVLLVSHAIAAAIGFAAGIYLLPILTAPEAPSADAVSAAAADAQFSAKFVRELPGSDFLHWGEGSVSIGPKQISLMGKIAPGPDYKLYLSPSFVDDEASFNKAKSTMVQVGDIKTFENFILAVPASIDVARYKAVVIWCESFGEFITAARYQKN